MLIMSRTESGKTKYVRNHHHEYYILTGPYFPVLNSMKTEWFQKMLTAVVLNLGEYAI